MGYEKFCATYNSLRRLPGRLKPSLLPLRPWRGGFLQGSSKSLAERSTTGFVP